MGEEGGPEGRKKERRKEKRKLSNNSTISQEKESEVPRRLVFVLLLPRFGR